MADPEETSPAGARAAQNGGPAAARPRRGRGRLLLALLLVVLAADLLRPPQKQLSSALLLRGIAFYQVTLSPRLPFFGVSCRFTPTCSRYGKAVIARDGALVGLGRTLTRIGRCGPWTPAGTHDPP